MKLIILSFPLCVAVLSQIQQATVVKKNGHEVRLTEITFFQSEREEGSAALSYIYNGRSLTIAERDAKRINLNKAVEKSKGITTWEALLVRTNGDKLEIRINLNKIKGKSDDGKIVTIPGGAIDKISF